MIEHLDRLLNPLRRQVGMMVGRALVRLVDDAGGMQLLQVEGLEGEVLDDVEHALPYGLASAPKTGSTGLILSIGGVRAHAVAICVGDRRVRIAGLQSGEVALYDDLGQVVKLRRDGIEMTSPMRIKVDAPEIILGPDEAPQPVARQGDAVADGVITGGSTVVKAG